jgi:hypothetical protein
MWKHTSGYWWHDGWSWMGFDMISLALFLVLIIVAVVALIRFIWKSQDLAEAQPKSTASDVLRKREHVLKTSTQAILRKPKRHFDQ